MSKEKFNLKLCPGYLEAVKRENDIRDAAMLNVNSRICGMEVRQITLRHWIILDAIDTPFQRNETPSKISIIEFLWVLNPKYSQGSYWRAAWFSRKLLKLDVNYAANECQKFWDETFQDKPPTFSTTKGFQSPQVSFSASVIFRVCKAVNADKEQVLNMPLKEAFQYLKLARMQAALETGEPHCEGNPSDAIRSAWIREQREIAREEAA